MGSIAPARKTVFHWLVRIKFANHQRECVVVMETLPSLERVLEQVLKHSFILPKQDMKKLCYLFQKLFINPFLILLILFHYLILPLCLLFNPLFVLSVHSFTIWFNFMSKLLHHIQPVFHLPILGLTHLSILHDHLPLVYPVYPGLVFLSFPL